MKKQRSEALTISFSDEDLVGVRTPHDDALVVTLTVHNYEVRRILVDNGSSAEILFYEAFERMGLLPSQLTPTNCPLVGFAGSEARVEGTVLLKVTVGRAPRAVTTMMTFLVVKCPSSYNAILGRTGLNGLRAVVSTYHLVMKFLTPEGVGEVRGDQHQARRCYVASLKAKVGTKESLSVESFDIRDELRQPRSQPVEELSEELVGEGDPAKVIRVGSLLQGELRAKILGFLRSNADVFAWSPADVPGIDPGVSVHRLNVDPGCQPVRQKKRTYAPERHQAIAEEVGKLLEAGFIREVDYP